MAPRKVGPERVKLFFEAPIVGRDEEDELSFVDLN